MKWIKTLIAIEPDSTKGRLFFMVVDKLLIGAIIAGAFIAYDQFRSEAEAAREMRALEAQLKIDRLGLSKELLPYFLDETTDVDARGYLLLSSLLSGLIDANLAIEISSDLIDHGITERLIHRIVALSLPEGLGAIARQGARIQDSMRNYDNVSISGQVKDKSRNFGEVNYIPNPDLPTELQALVKQRSVWNATLRESMPNVDKSKEEEIVTPQFLTSHLNSLYFLLDSPSIGELFPNTRSTTLNLIGALECVIYSCGRSIEAADLIGSQLASINSTEVKDLNYARTLVRVIREYGINTGIQGQEIAPEMAIHLARVLVDDSFLHRIPWLPKGASRIERERWLSEKRSANTHSSLQYDAGVVLYHMRNRAHAEDVLVSFIDGLVRDVKKAQTQKDVALVSSRYGNNAVRFAVEVLVSINTPGSQAATQKLKGVGDDNLALLRVSGARL